MSGGIGAEGQDEAAAMKTYLVGMGVLRPPPSLPTTRASTPTRRPASRPR
ncbi:YdcF family protein [Massilia sp. B-10]|nr:YdcF family protein [Massilia sp. B-10]